jgi:hypothetical protein
MTKFTDMLGNPIAPGDTIAYPVCSGSSSASIQFAVVQVVDEIVREGNETFLHSQRHRLDRPHVSYPGRNVQVKDPSEKRGWRWEFKPDPSRAFVLSVCKVGKPGDTPADRKVRISNVDRVIVIDSLVR